MSANLASTDPHLRPLSVNLPPPPVDQTQFDHEWAVAAKYAVSYAGPYTISGVSNSPGTKPEFEGEVRHGPLTVASFPGMVGSTQVREYALYHDKKDGILLKITGVVNGVEGIFWWRKLDK